jgi:hypothetical protein
MCVSEQPAADLFELLTQFRQDVADNSLDTLARVAIYPTARCPVFASAQRHKDFFLNCVFIVRSF